MSELLSLCSDVPRSLHVCIKEPSHILVDLSGSYSRAAQRLVAEFVARLRYNGIYEILDDCLHGRLTDLIETARELALIHTSYLDSDVSILGYLSVNLGDWQGQNATLSFLQESPATAR